MDTLRPEFTIHIKRPVMKPRSYRRLTYWLNIGLLLLLALAPMACETAIKRSNDMVLANQ